MGTPKPTARVLAGLCLALATFTLGAAAADAAGPRTTTLRWGPVTVPGKGAYGPGYGGIDVALSASGASLPCKDCFLTGVSFDVVNADGSTLNRGTDPAVTATGSLLSRRESLFSYIFRPTLAESRRIAPVLNTPYVVHTTDETSKTTPGALAKNHIACLRTKGRPGDPAVGAKYAVYSQWTVGSTVPDTAVPPDHEFYDYAINAGEMGNNSLNPSPGTLELIDQFEEAMGGYGPPASAIIGTELTRPLVGTGTGGEPLTVVHDAARQAYLDFIAGPGCEV